MDHLPTRIVFILGALLLGIYLAATFPDAGPIMRAVGFVGLGLFAANQLLQLRKK